jgi:drug/metabolite transporter (DMT)-like permease
MFLILLLQALWGASNPISKYLLQMQPPIFLAAVRMLFAGGLLLGYQLCTKQSGKVNPAYWGYYLQIIFFGIYIKYIFRYWGLSHLPVAKMSFLLNCTPFFVALFSYLFLKERLTKQQWFGLSIGFLGLLPLLLIRSSAELTMHQFLFISLPELAIIIEIAAHSYALILTRKLIRDLQCSASMTNGIRMFGGGILALLTALLIEPIQPLQNPAEFFGWLSMLVLVSNVFCHSLYLHLLNYYSATFLAFTDFLCPIFAAIYGRIFLHELLSWHYPISAIIVFSALYIFHKDELHVAKIAMQKA